MNYTIRPAGPEDAAGISALRRMPGTGGGDEFGLVHGREEGGTGDFLAPCGERRHVLAGIGRVEVLQRQGAAVVERDDKIVPLAGKGAVTGRKIKNEQGVGRACNMLYSARGGPGKAYVGHGDLLRKEEVRGGKSRLRSCEKRHGTCRKTEKGKRAEGEKDC